MSHISPFTAADLAHTAPVSPGIAQAVWQAHEENIERSKRTQVPAEMRGRLWWSASLAKWQFEPGAGADAAIMDMIASGKLTAEVKVTLSI